MFQNIHNIDQLFHYFSIQIDLFLPWIEGGIL